MTSGRGSRFILANTEQLHEKITQLSDRVRELEDALGVLHRERAGESRKQEPHPLLSPEKLQVKTSQDLYGIPQDRQQPQPVTGPSRPAPPTDVDMKEDAYSSLPLPTSSVHSNFSSNPYPTMAATGSGIPTTPEVSPDILRLSKAFPFPWPVDLHMRGLIRDALPPRHEAQEICEQAQKNALWQYHLDSSATFSQNLLHHCYTTPTAELGPRRLALLLMLLAIGSVVDLRVPSAEIDQRHHLLDEGEHRHHAEAHHHAEGSHHHHSSAATRYKEAHHRGEAYHHLARAAACEIPLMEEPNFDVLHALFFMIWWHLIFSDSKKSVGYAWNLMGLVTKLAQGLGLHRDNPRLKGIPEEYEKRSAIFWELLNLDCRMSLSLGRPPSMSLSHIDTKQPAFSIHVPKEEILYHEWKNAFFAHCLAPVLDAVVIVNPPPYARFLELDVLVRDFDMPVLLLDPDDLPPPRADERSKLTPSFLVMQRALAACSREIALLQLHRRFFVEAMSSVAAASEPLDLHHPHAPSVLATFIGAVTLVSIVEKLFSREPQLSSRFLCFWFNAYSAAVTLSLFVSRAPSTPFAPNAARELDRICRLFRDAAKILPISGRILPLVEKFATKARESLKNYRSQNRGNKQDKLQGHWNVDGIGESLLKAHPALLRQAEALRASVKAEPSSFDELSGPPPPSPISSPKAPGPLSLSYSHSHDSGDDVPWRPKSEPELHMLDIYRYANAGVGPDAICLGRTQPRVGGKEGFNLDHGSLAGEFGQTSYMAWF